MTEKVVSLRGAPVAPAGDEVDASRRAFHDAVERALADGATRGVLVYEGSDGCAGYVSVFCGPVALRGIIEEGRDLILSPSED